METLLPIMRIAIGGWLICLAAIVFYRILTGDIITKGLLDDKGSRSRFSPARVQLLVSSVAIAGYYIATALTNTNTGRFPTIPNEMLLILGGSHAFYLGSKTIALILQTFGFSNNARKKP